MRNMFFCILSVYTKFVLKDVYYSAHDWLLKNGYPVSICSFVESIKDLSTCLVLKELQCVYWTTDFMVIFVLYIGHIFLHSVYKSISRYFPLRLTSMLLPILCLDYSLLVVNDISVFLTMGNQVGYYFAPSGKPYLDNWIITDVIYEIEGSLFSR